MEIRPADVHRSLETIGSRLAPILDDTSHSVIAQAKAMLLDSAEKHRERVRQANRRLPPIPWGFRIEPEAPLRFNEIVVDRLKFRVDLFLRSYWDSVPAAMPAVLNVAIRIWALDDNVCFREDWDAQRLASDVLSGNGRVMLRMHFDLANRDQDGPKYHLQFGGNQHEGELNWFPENLSVPRLLHSPVDLVLASEMIAATFYADDYKAIRRESSWLDSMRTSQVHLLSSYLTKASTAVLNGTSLLESLWNVAWE